MAGARVMVVDDDLEVIQLVVAYLQRESYQVTTAGSGQQALELVRKNPPELLVLDRMLPDGDGLALCLELRRVYRALPILMLSARSEDVDRIIGLEVGADDYLSKPFNPKELVARVRALLRRAALGPTSLEALEVDNIRVLSAARRVFVGDTEVQLTPIEFSLLKLFLSSTGTVFSRQELLDRVWGQEFFGDERTIDAHIRNLRGKLRRHDRHFARIQSVWGVGYRFD